MLSLTLQNFDDLVSKAAYAVVVFTAVWNTNAAASLAVINLVSVHPPHPTGLVLVGTIDFDSQRELVDRFSIRELPTILGFKAGVLVNRASAVLDNTAFETLLGL